MRRQASAVLTSLQAMAGHPWRQRLRHLSLCRKIWWVGMNGVRSRLQPHLHRPTHRPASALTVAAATPANPVAPWFSDPGQYNGTDSAFGLPPPSGTAPWQLVNTTWRTDQGNFITQSTGQPADLATMQRAPALDAGFGFPRPIDGTVEAYVMADGRVGYLITQGGQSEFFVPGNYGLSGTSDGSYDTPEAARLSNYAQPSGGAMNPGFVTVSGTAPVQTIEIIGQRLPTEEATGLQRQLSAGMNLMLAGTQTGPLTDEASRQAAEQLRQEGLQTIRQSIVEGRANPGISLALSQSIGSYYSAWGINQQLSYATATTLTYNLLYGDGEGNFDVAGVAAGFNLIARNGSMSEGREAAAAFVLRGLIKSGVPVAEIMARLELASGVTYGQVYSADVLAGLGLDPSRRLWDMPTNSGNVEIAGLWLPIGPNRLNVRTGYAPVVERPSTVGARYQDDWSVYRLPSGDWNYPNNPPGGFMGPKQPAELAAGTRVDRFGPETGSYLAPEGTPFAMRSLPPSSMGDDYHAYAVAPGKTLPVFEGQAKPAFDQQGLGTQYQIDWKVIADTAKVPEAYIRDYPGGGIKWLVDNGYLVRLTPANGIPPGQ
jgi:hypothetical protein